MQTTKRVVTGIGLILIALGLALQNYLPQNIDWWATSWLLCALLIAVYGFANKSLVVGCAGVGLTLGQLTTGCTGSAWIPGAWL